MGDIIVDGKTAVWFVPTIANIASPTVAEIGAGERISQWMPADGLTGFQPETAAVDNTGLESTFDTSLGGRASYSNPTLRLKKQDGTDTRYRGTLARGVDGFVVVRRGMAASTAVAASQKMQVHQVNLGETRDIDPEKNSTQRYEVPCFITAEPNLNATVAA